jgi:ABC-type phosphate transport system substrate-binding protein
MHALSTTQRERDCESPDAKLRLSAAERKGFTGRLSKSLPVPPRFFIEANYLFRRFSKGLALGAGLLAAGFATGASADVMQINGAGATFPYPVYSQWADAKIKALNPRVSLPSEEITVVHRSDGSGTTFIFTNYLTKVSKAWAGKVGNSKSVDWPVGIGGKGNEGVASYVTKVKSAIGYVEYAYALQNHMSYVALKNRDGNYVAPTSENFQAAAAGADWKKAPGYYMVLTDQPGAKSWPITGASFILVYKQADKPQTTAAVLKFFDWAYHHGQTMAEKLDYVPIPESLVHMVEQTWAADIHAADGKPVWTDSLVMK